MFLKFFWYYVVELIKKKLHFLSKALLSLFCFVLLLMFSFCLLSYWATINHEEDKIS